MKSLRKLLVFFAIFSLFSSMTFAAPGGGERDRDRGGGKERPGGRQPSRERNSPAANRSPSSNRSPASNRSPSSRSSTSKSSPDSRSDRERLNEQRKERQDKNDPQKSSPSNAKTEPQDSDKSPADFHPDSKSEPKSSPSSPNVSQTDYDTENSANNSQSQQKQSEIIFYRGNRTLSEVEKFTIQNVKSERSTSGDMVLELTFNQSINPRSFNANSILVNGEELSSKIKFTFNKKGDTIKVAVPAKEETISLTIQDVESFDGTKIEPTLVNINQ